MYCGASSGIPVAGGEGENCAREAGGVTCPGCGIPSADNTEKEHSNMMTENIGEIHFSGCRLTIEYLIVRFRIISSGVKE